jgi:hypothetical protein
MLAMSQTNLTPTASIRVFGEIEKEATITLESLGQMKQETVVDQLIYNHNGDVKDTRPRSTHDLPLCKRY